MSTESKVVQSTKKMSCLAQWIKVQLFDSELADHLPQSYFEKLAKIAAGYIKETKYMYDFWSIIRDISPRPSWCNFNRLDYITEQVQEQLGDDAPKTMRKAFENDGGVLPYPCNLYCEDDLSLVVKVFENEEEKKRQKIQTIKYGGYNRKYNDIHISSDINEDLTWNEIKNEVISSIKSERDCKWDEYDDYILLHGEKDVTNSKEPFYQYWLENKSDEDFVLVLKKVGDV